MSEFALALDIGKDARPMCDCQHSQTHLYTHNSRSFHNFRLADIRRPELSLESSDDASAFVAVRGYDLEIKYLFSNNLCSAKSG